VRDVGADCLDAFKAKLILDMGLRSDADEVELPTKSCFDVFESHGQPQRGGRRAITSLSRANSALSNSFPSAAPASTIS